MSTRSHFKKWAAYIFTLEYSEAVPVAKACILMFRDENPEFDRCRFLKACGFSDPEFTEMMHATM